MSNINITTQELTDFIEVQIIAPFYASKLRSLQSKSLEELLKIKNPYLFRVKNIMTGQDFVKQMLDAFLSSSEETIFGNLLEKLAIFVCQKKFGGYKPIEGEFKSIDLIFNRDNKTYIVGIKSGNKWGNADSRNKMVENLTKSINRSEPGQNLLLVSGICYGTSKIQESKGYLLYQGQAFWELVSGDDQFYIKIIEPLGKAIKGKDLEFEKEYIKKLNQMSAVILQDFCLDYQLDWKKIAKCNNGS